MTPLTPRQEWWTADEIAGSGLPDLPLTRQGIDAQIKRLQWRSAAALARRREGKGGGWEYSWKLFPSRAQRKLLQEASSQAEPQTAPARQNRDEAWTWYEQLPQSVKSKALARLAIIQQVEAFEPVLGQGRHLAILSIARASGVGGRTVWTWFDMITGVRIDDRLPYLAPRNRAQAERPRSKDCAPEFFAVIKSDYLRPEAPPFTDCFRRAVKIAGAKAWDMLPERTMRRRLDAAVPAATQVLARKGIDAVKRLFHAQVRDKSAMHALEGICGDNHRIDVFVKWPATREEKAKNVRPHLMVWQDIYSGKILAWRCDLTANSAAVLLAAGDLIETWGIPEHVLVDNGREFAAKNVTGGAATRFKFLIKDDDIPGLFTGLGCTIHWATPYSGQSKPIERAFRDFCQSIAKDPRFAGAYTGNRPDAKPENYQETAVPLEDFLRVVAEGIDEHNTRQGRRSEVAWGRSFDEVFAESYARAPIRKATEAQRRLWLLGAEGLRADRNSGRIKFKDNEYWEPWMGSIAGQRVVIRFDPAALWSGLHVYSTDNAYLGHAPCQVKAGFFDVDAARTLSRNRTAWMKAQRAEMEAHRKYEASQIGAMLDDLDAAPAPMIEAKVVKPIFGKGRGLPSPRDTTPAFSEEEVRTEQVVIVADLAARRGAARNVEETERERFRRALVLEDRIKAGGPVTAEQERWLSIYQNTSEYRSEHLLWEDFGDSYFG